jgi:DNA-3-methyladenine glycosylase II
MVFPMARFEGSFMAPTRPISLAAGLDAEGASAALARADRLLRPVIRKAGPCTLAPERGFDPFGALASAIAHQQLNGRAAQTILGRFKQQVGNGKLPDATQVKKVRFDVLRAVGFSNAKALALKDLAAKTLDGTVPTAAVLRKMGDDAIVERLIEVRGVGRWTVEMMLMFRLGRLDVFPVDDYGVRKGYSLLHFGQASLKQLIAPKTLLALGEPWRPYRSVAAWYLWRVLEQQS